MLTLTSLAICERRTISDGHVLNYRRSLCERSCTLNGKPGQVTGARNPFAYVLDRDTGLGCEYAWPTVERVLAAGGRFKS